jgi:hypothetical protein
MDLGAAILDFYSSLVDLLAKCAPDRAAIQAGKGDSVRARAILRSLISLDDLGQILSLRFTIPNLIGTATASQDGRLALHFPAPAAANQRATNAPRLMSAVPMPLPHSHTFPSAPPPPFPQPSQSLESNMASFYGLVDTASHFASIAASLSSRMRLQSLSGPLQ